MSRPLLEHRLIFVTGKGGVGKTTIAQALGLLAARRGLRTIVAEIGPPDGRSGLAERELAPGLFTITIDPQAAMEEYLRIKAGPLGGTLSRSRIFGALAMATPGMRELLAMGKVWELAQLERRSARAAPYDLVLVDAPATGHGVAALRTPRVFADTARVGPIAHQAGAIAASLADRSFTAVLAVALAEEMPVNETLALAHQLSADGLELERVVLNARYPERFDDAELERLAAAPPRPAVAAAISEQRRATGQRSQADRLTAAFGAALITLPFLFDPEPTPVQLVDALEDALC